MLSQPFDGEVRIEAKGFGHVRFRLVHLAQGARRQPRGLRKGVNRAVASVEYPVVYVDRGFEMTGSKFDVAQLPIPLHPVRVIRAQPNRLLDVGFCLVETAEGYFRLPRTS